MKLFLICSKAFYDQIPPIKAELEQLGHEITLPNSYDNPQAEEESQGLGEAVHREFKKRMFERSRTVTKGVDAVLALNFDKHGQANYIGGATFLELYDAFILGKTVYLWNDIPEGILSDEIHGFAPIIINGKLGSIK